MNRLLPWVAAATLALAGCGATSSTAPATGGPATTASSATPSPSSSSSVSASPSPSPSLRTVTVTVTGRTVSPAPASVRVEAGEPVRLVVTADTANELHVHGIDVERPLTAGVPTTVDVTFPDPGVYEVETHEPSLLLLRFEVR